MIQHQLIKKEKFTSIQDAQAGQSDPIKFSETLIDSSLGNYRYRIWDYRVIFDVGKDSLIILRIGQRGKIYR